MVKIEKQGQWWLLELELPNQTTAVLDCRDEDLCDGNACEQCPLNAAFTELLERRAKDVEN